jgi:SAM-dependent methyltransferase
VYNEFGWNYYPEIFGQQLLLWLQRRGIRPATSMDLACGTGVLCRILRDAGIRASGMDLSAGMIDIAREASPEICYEVADMITFCPREQFELVTCTGDALNHIGKLEDIGKIFRNVFTYTAPGGYFVFDILNEQEVSTSEPFEMDFTESVRVWFQMTRPEDMQVNLKVRVFEEGRLQFEENIRETIHDPVAVCDLLRRSGFIVEQCADRLLEDSGRGTTWFVVAKKPA